MDDEVGFAPLFSDERRAAPPFAPALEDVPAVRTLDMAVADEEVEWPDLTWAVWGRVNGALGGACGTEDTRL